MRNITQAAIRRRRARQGGSAMLIVFLFAAVIAIMLYRELPVTLFEAQRQKEQLLVDRGHEYTRAVQLYYRRFRGQYPASIDQLENTNNMRFLRHRFKDPFTGKDDWRLLHAGPGGMLIDSKVNPLKLNNANGSGQPGANHRQARTSKVIRTNSTPISPRPRAQFRQMRKLWSCRFMHALPRLPPMEPIQERVRRQPRNWTRIPQLRFLPRARRKRVRP